MKASVAALLLLGISCTVYAQQYQPEPDLERIADALYGNRQDDLDYQALYENLALLIASPLDLNKATAEELQVLRILSDAQIASILRYRTSVGRLLSVYELQAIPELDIATCQLLAPFITTHDPSLLTTASGKPIYSDTERYILFRYEQTLEQQAGFLATEADTRFQGARGKRYLRTRIKNSNGIHVGITAENDAGEALAWSPRNHRYGFDYLSAYAQITKQGRLQNLIVGDYQVQLGQGLVFGSLLGMGKGSEAVATVRQPNIGFMPWSSAYEAGYRRGVAATVALNKQISISTFFSRARRDAATQSDSVANTITTLYTSGLHRNLRELATRRQITECTTGGALQLKTAGIDAGILFEHLQLSTALQPRTTVYNPLAFHGDRNTNTSLYLNYTVNNLSFFTEVAHTVQNGWAGIGGVIISLTHRLDMALLYRRFAGNYHTFYGSAFGEASTPQNETGTYWGWKYTAGKKISASGYADLFRFAGMRYRIYSPSGGHEWLMRINYQPSKSIRSWLQVREEQKMRNTSAPSNLYTITQTRKHQYQAGVEYGRDGLTFKSQLQACTFRTEGKTATGMAVIQDIRARMGKLRCTARYALFDTETYDTRLYTYENDVWLAYSLPAYAGKGVRRYILLEYKLSRYITLWLRYANTRYTDRDEISSGMDRIAGNVRNDIKFEVRVAW